MYKGKIKLKTIIYSGDMFELLNKLENTPLKGLIFEIENEFLTFKPKQYVVKFESQFKKYIKELIKIVKRVDPQAEIVYEI